MMGWYGDGWGGSSWLAMSLMLLFWIALIALGIWAAAHFVRADGSTPAAVSTAPAPRAILDHRLAAGEIDTEQYAQLRRLLDGPSAGTGTADSPTRP